MPADDSSVPVFTPKNYKETFQKRTVTSQFADPCEEASKASMDCLNRHDYDRDKCLDFFQAYRDCKRVWNDARQIDAPGSLNIMIVAIDQQY
ncbi:hypothetical protein BJV74DRAFT_302893 [Russula compacta]|nr:hypothetical protein BJV74DRAFT_302893 [Russula compacta]